MAFDKNKRPSAVAWRERNRDRLRAYDKAYRALNREKLAAKRKVYNAQNREERNALHKAWRDRNLEHARAYDRAWSKGSENKKARIREWREKNPEKIAAHHLAAYHIPLPDTCESCGAGGLIHRHHPDYTKPLLVEFLCPRCHKAAHQQMKRGAGTSGTPISDTTIRTISPERPTTSQQRRGVNANST